mgnify:CR=1 FL=1
MKKILVVSHCLLNTASKVKRFKEESIRAEEALRQQEFPHLKVEGKMADWNL